MRILAILIAAMAAGPAFAGAVNLRAETLSAGDVVTLGDLFDGAGAAARVPVATRTGATVVLDAAVVQRAALRAGLEWANAEGLHKIVVHGGPAMAPAAARGNVEVLTYTRSLAAGE